MVAMVAVVAIVRSIKAALLETSLGMTLVIAMIMSLAMLVMSFLVRTIELGQGNGDQRKEDDLMNK